MDKPRTSYAPLIIAIVLLLLPVVYVGSYFALVVPAGRMVMFPAPQGLPLLGYRTNYRIDGYWSRRVFWPLEQIDRKLRPGAWEDREWLKPRDNLYRPI